MTFLILIIATKFDIINLKISNFSEKKNVNFRNVSKSIRSYIVQLNRQIAIVSFKVQPIEPIG